MADQLSLERDKTAVLIMDYQYRPLSLFPEAFQNELLARANTVLAGARLEGIPVIHVEVQRGERTPETKIHSAVTPPSGEVVLAPYRAILDYGPGGGAQV